MLVSVSDLSKNMDIRFNNGQEEAAEFVLEFVHALDGLGHQGPGQVLVGQPFAALDGVHEVALDRIAGCQRHVVAALHHARAAAFAEQALDGQGDLQVRRGRMRVQGSEQARAAGAEDQDVGGEAADHFDLIPVNETTRSRKSS